MILEDQITGLHVTVYHHHHLIGQIHIIEGLEAIMLLCIGIVKLVQNSINARDYYHTSQPFQPSQQYLKPHVSYNQSKDLQNRSLCSVNPLISFVRNNSIFLEMRFENTYSILTEP